MRSTASAIDTGSNASGRDNITPAHITKNATSPTKIQTYLSQTARITLVLIALAVLLLGVMVYLFDRSASSVYFIPSWLSHTVSVTQIFGATSNHLPTFVHPFAFILFTAALAATNKKHLALICLAWLVIDSSFEAAQIPTVAQWLTGHIPAFNNIPLLENTQNYLIHGTFDGFDLLSILLGTMAAYFVVSFSSQFGKPELLTQATTRHGYVDV